MDIEPEKLLSAAMERLSLPPRRTEEPLVIVAAGGRAETSKFFDVLSSFFPLVYVSRGVIGDLPEALLADLCRRLATTGVCPFLEVGDIHPSRFSHLPEIKVPVKLIWVVDTSQDELSHSGRDKLQWLMSAIGAPEYYLVDSSLDMYPQVFSLPFLPGERR